MKPAGVLIEKTRGSDEEGKDSKCFSKGELLAREDKEFEREG